MSKREDIARLVWIGGGGTSEGWDRNSHRPPPSYGPERPNYIDEKVAEAWATADTILEYLSASLSASGALNHGAL